MTPDEIIFPWDIVPDPTPTPDDIPITPTEEIPADDSKIMWHAMEAYHNMGLSMMWGRVDPEPERGKAAKSPIVTSWSSDIERRFTLDELSKVMVKINPKIRIAPIIICGAGSGNLIVIDLDTKHWPGIDTLYYTAVRETYPELWKLLRRHKTMTDGRHLYYRTIEPVEFPKKNPGLAKKKGAKEFGIECRTHGGYVMAPPGAGYTVEYDVEIPTISVEDHERLFKLARLLNEEIPVVKTYTSKVYDSIYDESPGQHFNSSPAAETILQDNGWTFDYQNSQWSHYTRPGKTKGVSASWHKTKRFYHVFTNSTDLIGTNFSPAALRCHFECQDDWKKFYPILVKEGFGKHKANYEEKVIRKAVETGKPLPPNFSQEAKEQLIVAVDTKNEKYPHGIFWEYNPTNDSYSIQREKLSVFMENIGLRLYKGEPMIIEAPFIRKLKEDKNENGASDVFNVIKAWIKEEDEIVYYKINHEFIKFWQSAGYFSVKTLKTLDNSLILKSLPGITYKAFKNGVLVIKPDEKHVLLNWYNISGLVFSDEVSDRGFKYIPPEDQSKSMYVDYITKAIKNHPEYVKLVVGYLCCGYKVSSESFLIAMLESSETKKGGGSGKGFFAKILWYWLKVLTVNGESVKKDIDQLLQSWNGEPLVHGSDLPKWATLSVLKNLISDDNQLKKLYENLRNVAVEDMPKFLVSTQFGLDLKGDGGVMGRVRVLAFTDYFDRIVRSIRDEYGGDCPGVWDSEDRVELNGGAYDWDGFLSYVADAVQAYQRVRRLPIVDDIGVAMKSFDMTYSGGDDYLRREIEEQVRIWGLIPYVTLGQEREWYDVVLKDNEKKGYRGLSTERLHEAFQVYGSMSGLYSYMYGKESKREYVDGVQQRVVRIKILRMEEFEDLGGEVDDEILPF